MDIAQVRELHGYNDLEWILVLESYIQYMWNIDVGDLAFHAELCSSESKKPLLDTDTVELT